MLHPVLVCSRSRSRKPFPPWRRLRSRSAPEQEEEGREAAWLVGLVGWVGLDACRGWLGRMAWLAGLSWLVGFGGLSGWLGRLACLACLVGLAGWLD